MQLNLTTTYAIRCMVCLAEHEEGVSSRLIGEEIAVDREFTLKILRMLRRAGLIKSTKGSAGGYRLANPASETPLWKIIEVTEDSMHISRSLEPGYISKVQEHRGDRENKLYRHLQGHIDTLLKGITLQDILEDGYMAQKVRKQA